MTEEPTVSVIIPTYNRANLIGRTVQSVLDQTYRDFEIIIVDDSSTDNTAEVVESFGDSRISYVRHSQNRGGSAARNTGLKLARGEYIGFLDSGDEWCPEKLGKQVDILRKAPSNIGVVYTGGLLKKENETHSTYYPLKKNNPKDGNLHQLFLKMNIVWTSTALVRNECFLKAGMFDESLPRKQERELWIRISKYYEFRYIPEALVTAYYHAGGISANSDVLPQALQIILKKHIDEIKLDRKLLADYYHDIGILLFENGEFVRGRKYLAKAVHIHCLNAKHLMSFFLTTFGEKIFRMVRKMRYTRRLVKT